MPERSDRSVIVQRNPFTHGMVGLLAIPYLDLHIRGEKHLDTAEQADKEGKSLVVIAGKHESAADPAAISKTFKVAGYKDLEKRLVYPLGSRFAKNRYLRLLLASESHFLVQSPFDIPETAEERAEAKALIKNAREGLKEVKEKKGIIVVFPEATRRNPVLGKGVAQVAHYLMDKDTITIPVAIDGTRNVLDVEQAIPRRASVTVSIGEPFNLSEEARRLGIARHDKQAEIDLAMRHIAVLLPQNRQGYYAQEMTVYENQYQTN